MMIENREESFTLSFDYPIPMNGEWKLYSSAITVAEGWNTASFSDNWETATLGTDAHSANGTQYFRKTFTGVDNMAAYEMRFNYRYGIIAYVNGKEVFRDNMDSGAATPSTPSSGAYDSTVYHGIILPASLISSSAPNLLAVELHFPALNETVVDFNAFVASVASSIAGDSPNRLCLRARVKPLRQVEARHQSAIEVHSHTSSVLHAHVQHVVVLQRRNLHLTADVRRGSDVVAHRRRLHTLPLRIIKLHNPRSPHSRC